MADAIADRIQRQIVAGLAASVNEAQKYAAGAQGAAQSSSRSMGLAAAASETVLDAEKRLMLSLATARDYVRETNELRRLILLTMRAGEQLERKAAALEQIDKTIIRRIDTRLRALGHVYQQAQATEHAEHVAERLRLNEQAEKWRKLAMSRIEAELDARPPATTISG